MKSLGSFEPFHKCTERSHGVSCVVNSFGPSLKLRPSVSLTGPKLILAIENVNREISSSLQVQAQRKLRCNSQMKLLHMIMYFSSILCFLLRIGEDGLRFSSSFILITGVQQTVLFISNVNCFYMDICA